MWQFDRDQLLKLYEIEAEQTQRALDHILTIRGMMAVAFAAILSATLIYRQGVIALGGLVFLAAWWWEYIYARYLGVYSGRTELLASWIAGHAGEVPNLSEAYTRTYDHRLLVPVARRVGRWRERRGKHPIGYNYRLFLLTFFDLPRMAAYLTMSFAPLVLAYLLGVPWMGR